MMSAAADQCLSGPAVVGSLKLESCFLFSASFIFLWVLSLLIWACSIQ
jgi:hypothetical protein